MGAHVTILMFVVKPNSNTRLSSKMRFECNEDLFNFVVVQVSCSMCHQEKERDDARRQIESKRKKKSETSH